LWWFRNRLAPDGVDVDEIDSSSWDVPVPDSLQVVELVMEMEEEFDLTVSEEDASQIKTIADAIRFLRKRQSGEE
jgi:acyl carrier protein